MLVSVIYRHYRYETEKRTANDGKPLMTTFVCLVGGGDQVLVLGDVVALAKK